MPNLYRHSVKRRVAANSVYRRSIHFRERITQWLGQAPPVLQYARERLAVAFAANRHRLRCEDGRERPLSVEDVRYLIHVARLSQRQFAEKFVQIRYELQNGYMRSPQPTANEVAAIEADYASIVRVWESYAELRGSRKNIINLNLILAVLILRNGGQRLYDAHAADFPTVGSEKWVTLFRVLERIARRIGWPYLPWPLHEKSRDSLKL